LSNAASAAAGRMEGVEAGGRSSSAFAGQPARPATPPWQGGEIFATGLDPPADSRDTIVREPMKG